MAKLKLTGGARIGMTNATYPFATLEVNKDKLELNVSILGNFVFQPSDIISIESYGILPIIGQGIKINHKVSTYKKKIIFWTFKNPNLVIKQIQETGFLNKGNTSNQAIERTIIEKQKTGGFPIKKGFSIGVVVVWNLLLLMNFIPFFLGGREELPIGNGVFAAVGLVFLTAFLSLVSSDFRRLILKEGRGLNDIKIVAIFVMIISGAMLFFLGLMSNV